MPKKVLLADDSVTIQKVISITLSNEDLDLTMVNSGEEALTRVREILPDLILIDISLPDKNGYQVCEDIKKDPLLKDIPVLLLAGAFEPYNEEEGRRVGADDHIVKPFESQELIDKVKALLERVPVPEPEEEAEEFMVLERTGEEGGGEIGFETRGAEEEVGELIDDIQDINEFLAVEEDALIGDEVPEKKPVEEDVEDILSEEFIKGLESEEQKSKTLDSRESKEDLFEDLLSEEILDEEERDGKEEKVEEVEAGGLEEIEAFDEMETRDESEVKEDLHAEALQEEPKAGELHEEVHGGEEGVTEEIEEIEPLEEIEPVEEVKALEEDREIKEISEAQEEAGEIIEEIEPIEELKEIAEALEGERKVLEEDEFEVSRPEESVMEGREEQIGGLEVIEEIEPLEEVEEGEAVEGGAEEVTKGFIPETKESIQEVTPSREEVAGTPHREELGVEASPDAVKEAIDASVRSVVEEIAWEVVPELIEKILREEIEKIKKAIGKG